MRQLVFGTSLTKKTSKDGDLKYYQISGDNVWPIIYSVAAVVQRFDNLTISTAIKYYIHKY